MAKQAPERKKTDRLTIFKLLRDLNIPEQRAEKMANIIDDIIDNKMVNVKRSLKEEVITHVLKRTVLWLGIIAAIIAIISFAIPLLK